LDCRQLPKEVTEDEKKWKNWLDGSKFNVEQLVDREKGQINVNVLEEYLKRYNDMVGGGEMPEMELFDNTAKGSANDDDEDEGINWGLEGACAEEEEIDIDGKCDDEVETLVEEVKKTRKGKEKEGKKFIYHLN